MENTELTVKSKETFSKIIIIEVICVTIVLLSLLTTKLFFGDIFSGIKKWYESNVCMDTDIEQVIETKGETGDISEV